jgi:hypothetical protein
MLLFQVSCLGKEKITCAKVGTRKRKTKVPTFFVRHSELKYKESKIFFDYLGKMSITKNNRAKIPNNLHCMTSWQKCTI